MTDYKMIQKKAAELRVLYGPANIRGVIRGLDLTLLELPMGTEPDSIRAFIMKSSRCAAITLNCDLLDDAVPFILAHETGHYVMNHLQGTFCAFRDSHFGYSSGSTELARMENEATFFAAEYLLDTKETLELLHEYDMLTAAKILKVPPEFLDFKARLMLHDGLIASYSEYIPVRSDFLKDVPLAAGSDPV
jgi:Zn-dependent peptidase ImmA (M78 family)